MIVVNPEYTGENKGHYSPGIISKGMLYISGQLSMDPNTRQVPNGGIEEHLELALSNIEDVLNEAGLDKNAVVQCRIYITDIDYWDTVNQIYAKFFGEHKPARIIVPVPELHYGCLTEIEAIAQLED
ncbi:RidA family protein [Tissierella carlieri]|uniref:RidA family protein n=1 Tax=Tissierella carlieri TaxID=689904 RepID=UPI001C123258|nr:RidA family protein [Tissierella carlieri]MBU5310973.1 RidA family protein [Tissierella carlieri]